MAKENEENFDIEYAADKIDDDTTVITSYKSVEEFSDWETQILSAAAQSSAKERTKNYYSVHTTDDTNSNALTLEQIDSWATGVHNDIDKLRSINQIILKYIDEDGLMGYAASCIRANTPTDYNIIYEKADNDDQLQDKLDNIQTLIENFNDDIKIERFIRDSVSLGYSEGNVPVVMRMMPNGNAVVDFLPLSIAYPSDYRMNGDPILEVDITTLKSKLQKTYKKTKKNKAIYFENIQKEIEANYPDEVVKAYKDNERYARLDTDYADCITVNSMGRKFGVSPFLRALRPLVVLNNIEAADVSDSKARSKKIIFQKLRKELLGSNCERKGFAEQEYAHAALMQALKTNLCAYTAPAFVENLEFVSSKANNDDASKQMAQYTTKYLQSLGIEFSDTEVGNYAGVNVSVTQIVRNINVIKSEVERVLNKFYKTLLRENGYDPALAPVIKIYDAEMTEPSMRLEMSKYIYSTLNGSRATAFKLIGIDLDDEKAKRVNENEKNYDEIFSPRLTSYTANGNDTTNQSPAGRPQSNQDKDKQDYDQQKNKKAGKS